MTTTHPQPAVTDLAAADLAAITAVIDDYFAGVHHGDVARLERAFHPDATLVGEVRGAPYRKSRAEYLAIVRDRPAPARLGAPYRMRVLGVDVWEGAAVARLLTPIGGVEYVDFMALQRRDGAWRIVHKLFAHAEAPGEAPAA